MPTIYKFDVAGRQISTESTPTAPDGMFLDVRTDTLYASEGGAVKPMASGSVNTAVWRSKVVKAASGVPTGFSWIRANGPLSAGVVVKLYADGALIYTTPPLKGEPARLPPRMARAWEIEMSGNERVTTLVLADNTESLL
jgi:hypothetical protein